MYVGSTKMVQMNLFTGIGRRLREQTCGHSWGWGGWGELGD